MTNGKAREGKSPYVRLEAALQSATPQVYNLYRGDALDFVSLSVRHRGANDFIAVLRSLDEDGGPIVCFGTGFDYVGALLGLEGAVMGNRWRKDEPWEKPGEK